MLPDIFNNMFTLHLSSHNHNTWQDAAYKIPHYQPTPDKLHWHMLVINYTIISYNEPSWISYVYFYIYKDIVIFILGNL